MIDHLFARLRNKGKNLRLAHHDNLSRNLGIFASRHHPSDEARPANFAQKIEVIIPGYNHGKYLEETFTSLLNQTWHTFPVTVTFIDDNSTDDTQAVIQQLTVANTANPNLVIKYIKNPENLRQWASLNKAIDASSNDLIIILNDDDYLVPDCLEKIVITLEKHKDLWMLGGSSIWFESKKPPHKPKPIEELKLTFFRPAQVTKFRELNDLNMTHSSMAVFKTAWASVGGYTPKTNRLHSAANEDRDFQLRVASLYHVGVYCDYPLAYWRTDSSHGKDF